MERENRTSRLTGTSPLPRRRQHRCLAQPRGINRLSLSPFLPSKSGAHPHQLQRSRRSQRSQRKDRSKGRWNDRKCRTTIHPEHPNSITVGDNDNDDEDEDEDEDEDGDKNNNIIDDNGNDDECVGADVLERENRTSRLTGTSPLPRRRQHRCLAQPRGINRLSLSLRFSHARVDYILINYIDHDEASDGRVDGMIYERTDGSVDGSTDGRIEVSVDVSVKGRVDGRVDGRVESVMQPFILHIQAASSLTTTTKTAAATK